MIPPPHPHSPLLTFGSTAGRLSSVCSGSSCAILHCLVRSVSSAQSQRPPPKVQQEGAHAWDDTTTEMSRFTVPGWGQASRGRSSRSRFLRSTLDTQMIRAPGVPCTGTPRHAPGAPVPSQQHYRPLLTPHTEPCLGWGSDPGHVIDSGPSHTQPFLGPTVSPPRDLSPSCPSSGCSVDPQKPPQGLLRAHTPPTNPHLTPPEARQLGGGFLPDWTSPSLGRPS